MNSILIEEWDYAWENHTGNLTQRKYTNEDVTEITENYDYDKLDRLTVCENDNSPANDLPDDVDISGTTGLSYGNISTKNHIGAYDYANYGDSNEPENAAGEISGFVSPAQIGISYENQTLTYTSFNSVETIIEGDYKKELLYGYDGQRILMRSYENIAAEGQPENWKRVATKYYADNFEVTEKDTITVFIPNDPNDLVIKKVLYVSAPTGLVAAMVEEKVENCTWNRSLKFYYILTDHLGSITQLLYYDNDELGAEINCKFTYDAWGRPRVLDANGNYTYNLSADQIYAFNILGRGYTGHEHLLDHDIINMNGRIYDPLLGHTCPK